MLPPIELQTRFDDFVRQTEKLKIEMQRGLDKLELLYKSLIQKCFGGEIFGSPVTSPVTVTPNPPCPPFCKGGFARGTKPPSF
jgi:hypothetical protein